jgi:hypothetical protein
MLKDTGKLAGIEGFEADTVRKAVAKILGLPYAGEGGTTTPATPDTTVPATPKPAIAEQSQLIVPSDFVLEGTMSINDIATALKASTAAIVAKLGLPADIALDKPLRDMKDQYGYSMTTLKEKIKQ